MDRLSIVIGIVAIVVAGFVLAWAFTLAGPGQEAPAQIPNPAAQYCKSLNNSYEIRSNPDGSQYGVCILPDGTVCDEWQFYRGNCPADSTGNAATDPWGANCLASNLTYTIRENPDGTISHLCVFPDGKACDAQAFSEGTCTQSSATMP
ncbi:MAG TPA: DUF333 domain-containing protein [Methanomicrobiales archaeon]|nr:DUF333 domain-containing protein [Methanomicrobiales archaeon]